VSVDTIKSDPRSHQRPKGAEVRTQEPHPTTQNRASGDMTLTFTRFVFVGNLSQNNRQAKT